MTIKEIIKSFIRLNKAHYEELKAGGDIAHLQSLGADEVYGKVHRETSPVFVLSTGRCGTRLMTEVLAGYDNLSVYHEPSPELSWHSAYAFHHAKNKHQELSMMFDVARYELIRDAYLTGRQYIETNNRISFFAYQIAELFPHAKFIHLYREPYSFVKSGVVRNWYSNQEIYDEGRITSGDRAVWENYSTEQKIAWLWVATNEFIDTFKSEFQDRVLSVSSRDLFNEVASWGQIKEFIGHPELDFQDLEKKLSTPVNPSRTTTSLSEKTREEIGNVLAESEFYKSNFSP